MVSSHKQEKGAVLVLVAVCLTMCMLMLSLALDFGLVVLTKSELQSAADSAALAAAAQLMDEDLINGFADQYDDIIVARDFAEQFAGLNNAANVSLLIDRNDANDISGGIVVGYIDDPFDSNSPFETSSVSNYNSVQVEVRLTENLNGPLELFFGGVTGMHTIETAAQTTATLEDRIVGFSVAQGGNLNILPFSVDVNEWDAVFSVAYNPSKIIEDRFGFTLASISFNLIPSLVSTFVVSSPRTLKIFPNDPDAPGNFGTIDIGSDNNSTSELLDDIRYGPSYEDIELIGGLTLTDDNGDGIFTKWFNGNTGVSSVLRVAIEDIIGESRILSLHKQVINTGDNSQFEVCRYVAVKVVDVKMTAALTDRYIEVEPIQFIAREAVVDPKMEHSGFVYALSITR
jgi:putative Flp pilus-assembly TadE/G-like protein